MRPVVFSASSVNAYLDCHLRWYFAYVLNETGEQSEAQRVGIKIHDYAERVLRHLGTAFIPDPEIAPLAKVFTSEILPTYRTPVLIEESFQVEVNGIGFSGVIDALDMQDVPWGFANILRDLKSTGKRPFPGKYRFNMIGYYLGVTEGLDHEVHALQLDYIVRTLKPYYWPEAQPLPTQDEIDSWAAKLETVANGVARSDYEPTGLGTYVCSYCSFKDICGPYARYQEITQE